MNHRITALIGAAALMAGIGIAVAQDGSMFIQVDENGDGNITAAEVVANAKTQFAQADTNRDGAISQAEFVAFRQTFFKQLDSNGDGTVTRAEMRSRFLASAFR